MPWHHFVDGSTYPTDEIVATVEEHLRSGDVKDVDRKVELLAIIEAAGSALTFKPEDDERTGLSWGRSPMNPRAWVMADGRRLQVP